MVHTPKELTLSCYDFDDVIMGAMAYQITRLTIVYSTVYSDADQRKHQSPASLAFVWGIHRGPRKIFPFRDVIMHSHKSCSGASFLLAIHNYYHICATYV